MTKYVKLKIIRHKMHASLWKNSTFNACMFRRMLKFIRMFQFKQKLPKMANFAAKNACIKKKLISLPVTTCMFKQTLPKHACITK